MKYSTSILFLLASFFLGSTLSLAATAVVEVRIADDNDDAEERFDGSVYIGSTDLELTNDDNYFGADQTIGLRFDHIAIPQGAIISSAYIEFTVDESSDNRDGDLMIAAQQHDDPPEFINTDHDISDRPLTNSVLWSLTSSNNWTNNGDKEQTPELQSLVQEIINRPGWESDQAMVFVITGDGKRVAESYDGSSSNAALLHIEYEEADAPTISVSPAASLGATSYVGTSAGSDTFLLTNTGTTQLNYDITADVSWLNCYSNCSGSLEPGTFASVGISYNNYTMDSGTYNGHFTITDINATNSPFEYDALLLIREVPTGSTCGEVPIYAQNLVDPAILVLMDVSSSMNAMMPVSSSDDNPKSPDVSAIVQEIVNRADWTSGNAMAFIISGSGKRVAEAYDGVSSAAPLLTVEYIDNNATATTLAIRVDQSNDDAEESSSGNVSLSSTDLELIREGSDQTVGLRFQDVTIPAGSTITSAILEFTVDETEPTDTTHLTIAGEDTENAAVFADVTNNISNRTTTSATVSWTITEQWDTPPEKARYVLGREAISELVEDETISWGYGTWAFNNYDGPSSGPDLDLLNANPYGSDQDDLYTKIHAGIVHRSGSETTALQAIINSTTTTSGTPFGPSLLAAREYYAGNKADETGAQYDNSNLTCQPKFLIDVTDGLGYSPHTSVDIINSYTNLLADEKISSVAVGFGIDNATQIKEMAKVANARGDADSDLYSLHETDEDGNGLPFIAQNQEELVTALGTITNSIKTQLFYGSSPAPSTSVDAGTFIIHSAFNASDWTGEISATPYDPETGAFMMCVDSAGQQTCNTDDIYGKCFDVGESSCEPEEIIVEECLCWSATDMMPETKNAWTVDGDTSYADSALATGVAGRYVDDHTSVTNYDIALDGDNYICKPLGDIIKATPLIVKPPNKYFNIDNYRFFKFSSLMDRDSMLYVGANDGALHAMDLTTGVEKWRFYPEAIHEKLTQINTCADDYCHEYFVDGTAVVSDVYLGTDFDIYSGTELTHSGWRSLLINGLGAGGDSYFALDVTSAKSFVENNTDPFLGTTYLWQFEDDELGLTMAQPVISRVGPSEALFGGWAAYFGSGYSTGNTQYKEGYVYGIEAYTAEDLWLNSLTSTSYNRIKLEDNDRIAYGAQTGTEFSPGEVVQGETSGASATIDTVVDEGIGGTLILNSITGNFISGEALLVGGSKLAEVAGTLHSAYYDDALSDVLVADLEFDNEGDFLYIGNMYGRMYRLNDIGKDQEPQKDVFFDVNPTQIGHNTPIRAGANIAYASKADTIWVYFGTGKFEEQADKFNTEQQYFIGLKDTITSPVSNSTIDDLLERSIESVTATFNDVTQEYRIVTGHTFAYDNAISLNYGDNLEGVESGATGIIDSVSTLNGTAILKLIETDVLTGGTFSMGEKATVNPPSTDQITLQNHPWYAKFPHTAGQPSERVVAKGIAAGGMVFFTSFIPDDDVCGGNGSAWLYALDYETGLSPSEPVFDLNGDGNFDDNDVVTKDGLTYFPVGISIGRGIPSAPVIEGDKVAVNTTDIAKPLININNKQLKANVSAWKDGGGDF